MMDLVRKAIEDTQGRLDKYCQEDFWLNETNHKILSSTAVGYVGLRKVFIGKEALRGAFEKKYFKFYVMRFVSPEYREEYFSKMVEMQHGAKYTIEELTTTLKDRGKTMFSFATKLLNMSNGISPLYDTYATSTMGLNYTKFPNERSVEYQYLACYEAIQKLYSEIIPNNQKLIDQFKYYISPNELLSTERIMDLILWRVGRIMADERKK